MCTTPYLHTLSAMGNRLTKITTRTGDGGTTGLGDGSRVAKTSARIAAIGDVDECNSVIGVLLTCEISASIRAVLLDIQHSLFDLGGELSIPGYTAVTPEHVQRLEDATQELNKDLPPLKDFILPGGCVATAHCHVARTVARRAERSVLQLAENEAVNAPARIYLNRLSDLLFVMARGINRDAGVADVLWEKARGK
jgi:cob(I)alamin adenosyltransferase